MVWSSSLRHMAQVSTIRELLLLDVQIYMQLSLAGSLQCQLGAKACGRALTHNCKP